MPDSIDSAIAEATKQFGNISYYEGIDLQGAKHVWRIVGPPSADDIAILGRFNATKINYDPFANVNTTFDAGSATDFGLNKDVFANIFANSDLVDTTVANSAKDQADQLARQLAAIDIQRRKLALDVATTDDANRGRRINAGLTGGAGQFVQAVQNAEQGLQNDSFNNSALGAQQSYQASIRKLNEAAAAKKLELADIIGKAIRNR
jgi:hypothetical protein